MSESRRGRSPEGTMPKVAALYVVSGGVYSSFPNVDCWDVVRDARRYAGPYPGVAHPPCERWGRYWSGGPSARVRRKLGDDGGCFAAAFEAVLRWGGVLEHPEASHAWRAHGLTPPPRAGGWVPGWSYEGHGPNPRVSGPMGWTCCVEQGHYGPRARKATWLYAVGTRLPELRWGKAEGKIRLDQGHHSRQERRLYGERYERITARECAATPAEFAELLIGIAASARRDFR